MLDVTIMLSALASVLLVAIVIYLDKDAVKRHIGDHE